MKRPERVVGIALGTSILGAIAAAVVYINGGQAQLEGVSLAFALGGLGAAIVLWAKYLFPEISDETQPRRHGTEPEPPDTAAEQVLGGIDGIRRRKFLSRMLIGAGATLGLAAIFPLRSLGRAPGDSLQTTPWKKGMKLVDENGVTVTKDTVEVDSFITVFPEGHVGSADGQAVLINVGPTRLNLPDDRLDGAPSGLVVYSKVCTHAGCAVGLYLAADHELRCPCHQSTFDVLNAAEPVYGPAPRALPQLLISIDPDGTLRAMGDFTAPIGPSFWDLET